VKTLVLVLMAVVVWYSTFTAYINIWVSLSILDHLHNITDLPKAAINTRLHGRSHAMRATDFHEVMVHCVKSEGVNMVTRRLSSRHDASCA
jgi:hypothetical protein